MDQLFESHLLEKLMEMGYTEEQATVALSSTHYVNVEAAVHWILEHPNFDEAGTSRAAEVRRTSSIGRSSSIGRTAIGQPVMGIPSVAPIVIHPDGQPAQAVEVGGSSDVKVVVVVSDQEASSSAARLATHCTRVAVALCCRGILAGQDPVPWMAAWMLGGQKVELLTVEGEDELQRLAREAEQLPIVCLLEAGSSEMLLVGPPLLALAGPSSHVDRVLAQLQQL